ncbi:MAG: hypothetical protein C5B58_16045 [Acidobacteria bacterium]|nr:MAG: hypothetical protein C5B58_16045 [Acidobacteriota bacterium]
MKTLSVRFRFVVTGIIAIVAVVSCCNFLVPDTKSYVELGHDLRGKTTHKRTYVPWKSQDKFDEALKQVCADGGTYCIYVLMHDSDPDPTQPYQPSNPPSNCTDCRRENIRTVKVTKSKAAGDIAAGGSAVNDPHSTYRVQSANPGDIIKVLQALNPQP